MRLRIDLGRPLRMGFDIGLQEDPLLLWRQLGEFQDGADLPAGNGEVVGGASDLRDEAAGMAKRLRDRLAGAGATALQEGLKQEGGLAGFFMRPRKRDLPPPIKQNV
jgi:hypothetical protein